MARTHKSGFTLLELSIVLTIIGLLVGGVLTGQALIQQARLNKVMTDIQKYITAFNTFQNKYNALPGDMSNATKYWGAAGTPTNTWAGCYSIVGTGTQTCDGNGDGLIYGFGSPWIYAEQFRAWQQLQLAGLIEGSYTGVNTCSGGTAVCDIPGTNIPKGPWQNSGYDIYYIGNQTGTASPYTVWPPVNLGHAIVFGAVVANDWNAQNPLLSPGDQLSIDLKYDDGLPFSGIISVESPTQTGDTNCVTSPYTAASVYNVSYQGPACSFLYVTGF